MASILDFLGFNQCSGQCGYYPDKLCTSIYTFTDSVLREIQEVSNIEIPITRLYSDFKEAGFCRFHDQFYIQNCYCCKECKAIRIPVKDFSFSKSQRSVWRKNQDVKVVLLKDPADFVTDEKVFMFREYDYFHNKASGEPKKTMDEAREQLIRMNTGYGGTWNMEYWLKDKLIGSGIIDYTTDDYGNINSIVSNYFYYDISDEVRKRSIGVFSVLKEIELCLGLNVQWYYLGLYLDNCKKMNYKANYKPCQVLVNNKWINYEFYAEALRGRKEINGAPLERVAEDCSMQAGAREMLLPSAGSFHPDYPELCFITSDIDLNVLIAAYRQGIFPWFNEENGDPVLWQCPQKRFVIMPEDFHVSKSIDKFLKHNPYTYTVDKCFDEVVEQCSKVKREGQLGTWIGPKMKKAYSKFHKQGFAHSFEVWKDGKLAGGFYGVLIGSVFCGESMFTFEPDSSKSAFVLFARAFFAAGGKVIDCQVYTDNMARYGAKDITRDEYLEIVKKNKNISMKLPDISL